MRHLNHAQAKPSLSHGWGLVETLLVLGAVSALSAGIYMVLSPATAIAQAKTEQDNLRDLSAAVERSFGLLGSYEGVSASRVVGDGLAPERMARSGVLLSRWGSAVTVTSESIRSGQDAFVVTYPATPSDVCVRLATAAARGTYTIRVNGQSVMPDGVLDPSQTASQCSQDSEVEMQFVYHSGLLAGTSVAASPLLLPPPPASVNPPASAPVGGPVGPVGPVGPANPVGPVAPATPDPMPVGTPVAPTPVSPVLPSTPAPSSPAPISPILTPVAACVAPPNNVENQDLACGLGQFGLLNQTRFASWSCPEAWEAPVQGAFSSWTTVGGSCTACPAPALQNETQWVTLLSTCLAGQYGGININYQQVRNRTVSYSCPAGTRVLPSPTATPWSGWSNTGATQIGVGTCTACPAPVPQNESQWVYTAAACPAGQSGSYTWEREQIRGRIVSYNCPAGTTSLPGATVGVWGGWNDTGGVRNVVNTCAPVAPTYTSRTVTTCSRSYRSGQADQFRRIIGLFEVATDNPGAYNVSWAPVAAGSADCLGCNISVNEYWNPTPNQLAVDRICASSSSTFAFKARSTHTASGAVFETVFQCRCTNIGL